MSECCQMVDSGRGVYIGEPSAQPLYLLIAPRRLRTLQVVLIFFLSILEGGILKCYETHVLLQKSRCGSHVACIQPSEFFTDVLKVNFFKYKPLRILTKKTGKKIKALYHAASFKHFQDLIKIAFFKHTQYLLNIVQGAVEEVIFCCLRI